MNWDGQWYRSIAESGYPATLPAVDGVVTQNEWAFYPGYPALTRLVMQIGLPFGMAAVFVSLATSALAITLIFRLVSQTSHFNAVAVTVGLCTFPTSPVFQVAYSEGLALLLIAFGLWGLRRRSYGQFTLACLALSLSRPISIALAGTGAVYWLVKWSRRERTVFHRSERWRLGIAVGFGIASMAFWPIIAAVVTGEANAYMQTQAAWTAQDNGAGLLGNWLVSTINSFTPALGIVVALAFLYLGLMAVWPTWAKIGIELRIWGVLYPLYLIAATRPVPSVIRYVLLSVGPLWPFPGLAEPPRGRWWGAVRWLTLCAVAGLYLVLQRNWVESVFTVQVAPNEQLFP